MKKKKEKRKKEKRKKENKLKKIKMVRRELGWNKTDQDLPFPNNIYVLGLFKYLHECDDTSNNRANYRKAIRVIREHNATLPDGNAAKKLKGIGNKMADDCDRILKNYKDDPNGFTVAHAFLTEDKDKDKDKDKDNGRGKGQVSLKSAFDNSALRPQTVLKKKDSKVDIQDV